VVVARAPRAGVVVLGLCIIAWLCSFWLFDRGSFGWWLIPSFGVLCVLAFARQAISEYVSGRVRRRAHK
jgi:hypothetical protein